VTRPAGTLPLLWFGVFGAPVEASDLPGSDWMHEVPPIPWKPSLVRAAFDSAAVRIRRYLSAGDTYQVNFTFRMRGPAPQAGLLSVFRTMLLAQDAPYAALLDTGRYAILSVSPELFFRMQGARLMCKPMKGTRPRGVTAEDDALAAERLRESQKDRAENVMIVDMVRNDMGRVADPGSVVVQDLYAVETYPTVLQMTSTVCGQTSAGLTEVFRALFPCASVTGAPKRRTMEIIAELEDSPRGIYTGAIGFAGPDGAAQFSVAIRTALVDRETAMAEYGVGSGIVWDSTPEAEYRECLQKARVLFERRPVFSLLETLRWTPARGYIERDAHIGRLMQSARYFGIPAVETEIAASLDRAAACFPPGQQRVRLLVDARGAARVESRPMEHRDRRATVCLCPFSVDTGDPFLYHKTTNRAVYERARSACPGFDDVLLWNAAGELTESTVANVCVKRGGGWVTPPVNCGLLAGTLRGRLVGRGRLRESVLRAADLVDGETILLINSLRGIRRAVFRRTDTPSPIAEGALRS
jgi:para-aminobenzoate synthetase/4-amino-4-deoxychorismate lyase